MKALRVRLELKPKRIWRWEEHFQKQNKKQKFWDFICQKNIWSLRLKFVMSQPLIDSQLRSSFLQVGDEISTLLWLLKPGEDHLCSRYVLHQSQHQIRMHQSISMLFTIHRMYHQWYIGKKRGYLLGVEQVIVQGLLFPFHSFVLVSSRVRVTSSCTRLSSK